MKGLVRGPGLSMAGAPLGVRKPWTSSPWAVSSTIASCPDLTCSGSGTRGKRTSSKTRQRELGGLLIVLRGPVEGGL